MGKFESYMSHHIIRLQIFLQRAFPWFYLRIFVIVSAYDNLLLRLRGYVRIYVNIFLYLVIIVICCIISFLIIA